MTALEAFHVIRPWWLAALPAVALLWWLARRTEARHTRANAVLAPHLRAALTVGGGGARRLRPVDLVATALALATLGAAGPTWSRVPDPFVADTAPVAIVLKVTPSMAGTDVAPTRLERAKQKIRDLLALRAGARTALVAYAGSAHRVGPLSDDPGVMEPYLEGLSPDLMPRQGADATAALDLAAGLVGSAGAAAAGNGSAGAGGGGAGGILLVLDTLDPADLSALDRDGRSVAVLQLLPEDADGGALDDAPVPVIRVSPDDRDVRAVERALDAAYRAARLADGTEPWDDRGCLLAWPAALLALVWFRRGTTMRWTAVVVLGLALAPAPARADGLADWFLTPDQQGRIAYERKDFAHAADLFRDPLWRGEALYRAGRYEDAAETFARQDSADAAFRQGLALIKGHRYRDGVRAFQTALDRDPAFPHAAENLSTAQAIVAFVEEAAEASDTGQDEPDDVVMDNEANRGQQAETGGATDRLLTADQWMNTVDTRTADFLRQRFAIEAAQDDPAQGGAAQGGGAP